MSTPQHVVEKFWSAFDVFDFEEAGRLLHDDFVFELPQSKERVRGRASFVAFNTHYPGQWRISIQRLVASGDEVVTEITSSYEAQTFTAISFSALRTAKSFISANIGRHRLGGHSGLR